MQAGAEIEKMGKHLTKCSCKELGMENENYLANI